jgi:hypothetical protein
MTTAPSGLIVERASAGWAIVFFAVAAAVVVPFSLVVPWSEDESG